MITLRTAHLAFVWIASVGADLFGLWAVWRHMTVGDPGLLALGLVSVVGGIGLTLYAVRLVRQLDEAHIR